jgi:peroxiredoxin (alkyl hydroperoxide reductase subunit C)
MNFKLFPYQHNEIISMYNGELIINFFIILVIENSNSHNVLSYTPRAVIRKPAPEFSGAVWYNGEIKKVNLSDFKGKWVVLFFYPLDFTFACPTEICNFSDSFDIFQQNNTELIGCSVDSVFSHREWALKQRKQEGLASCKLPLLSDINHQISKDYGVLIDYGDDKCVAFRGTSIIDNNGILRHYSLYDLSAGRNVDEFLRLVQAYQFSNKYGEVCPAKLRPGGKTLVPKPNSSKFEEYWQEELSTKDA